MIRWRTLGILLAALLTIGRSATADACPRWNVPIDLCTGTGVTFPDKCPPNQSFQDLKDLIKILWTKTAEEACTNYGKYAFTTPVIYKINDDVVPDGYVHCAPEDTPEDWVQLSELDITETCCSRTPSGPHTGINNLTWPHGSSIEDTVSHEDIANDYSYDVGSPENKFPFNKKLPVVRNTPAAGRKFTWNGPLAYERGVKDHHAQGVNVRRSNAVPASPLDIKGYPTKAYSALRDHSNPTLAGLENYCPDGVLDSALPDKSDCLPELDHIIPKKDIYGCDCGSSSYSNSILISYKLNQAMSNDCLHPSREAIMNEYAPTQFAAVVGNKWDWFAVHNQAPSSWFAAEDQDIILYRLLGRGEPSGFGHVGWHRDLWH